MGGRAKKWNNLTGHQRWILKKRKWTLKRLKYEYRTKVEPALHQVVKFTRANKKIVAVSIFLASVTILYRTLFSGVSAYEEDSPTVFDLKRTNDVVVFEGHDLNGEQRVLQPGVHWTGIYCNKGTSGGSSNFRSWQTRSPSNKWVEEHYPQQGRIDWDDPVSFCPQSLYVPDGYVVEFLGSNGIQRGTCQTPMRRHATIYHTKKYNPRRHVRPFISQHVRNTACHLLVVRKLNEILTFYEFKRHKGRSFSVDQTYQNFPLVLWTGLHCGSDSLTTNAYVQNILPLTNETSRPTRVDFSKPIGFLPRGVDLKEPGFAVYVVYLKEHGGCSEMSLPRWYFKGPLAKIPNAGSTDKSEWDNLAQSTDLAHLVVITKQ
jgi:hypothetical protein|eukprot:g4132.t1